MVIEAVSRTADTITVTTPLTIVAVITHATRLRRSGSGPLE
ncbi:hypothetical protein [Streptosporangium oxazolinicum]